MGLGRHDIALVRAPNPGPLTLSGTNSWVIGRDPCWIVDPGPDLPEHVDALGAEVERRGGLAAILLTHAHPDHADAVPALRRRAGEVVVAAAGWPSAEVRLGDGDRLGPLRAIATPGHSPDHLCLAFEDVCFTGDTVLGEGSVFVASDPGAMRGYLDGLTRLRQEGFSALLPGHGPIVTDPAARLDAYLAHRLERERRLVEALAAGLRDVDALLATVWSDVAPPLRSAAAATLAAHLDKLDEEGRLPADAPRGARALG